MTWAWSRATDEGPVCPYCTCVMAAAERELPPPPQLRLNTPQPTREPLRLWRCTRCGAERPRWG